MKQFQGEEIFINNTDIIIHILRKIREIKITEHKWNDTFKKEHSMYQERTLENQNYDSKNEKQNVHKIKLRKHSRKKKKAIENRDKI